MAEDKELSQLEAITNPSANDLMYIVSGGNSRKIPYGSVFPKDDYYTKTQMDAALAGKQNTLTFDATPTAQSTNPVTSGGIKSYVDGQGAKTASGNPITLTDAEAMNADHVVATITPTQTGSGTPSPSNVRPFVGFSEATIEVSKKNLLRNGIFSAGTQTVFIGGESGQSLHETYLKAGTYTLSVYMASGFSGNPSLYCAERNGSSNITIANGATQGTFSIVDDGYYRFWIFKSGGLSASDIDHFQLEVGNQATTYEPYQGNTYTVQLGDTYYGATLDVTSGKLTCSYKLATKTWGTYTYTKTRTNVVARILGTMPDASGLAPNYCDKLPEIPNWDLDEPLFYIANDNKNIVAFMPIGTSDDTTLDFCYLLETPIEIQLTPQQIALLENNNTITTNVSSLDITYQTNTAIGDTASALDKRVTRLEDKTVYSTTEKIVGTWIDGKPIYQKTFNLTLTEEPSSAHLFEKYVDVTDLNIDSIISIEGVWRRITSAEWSGYYQLGGYEKDHAETVGRLDGDKKTITLIFKTEGTDKQIFTIKYTKTS